MFVKLNEYYTFLHFLVTMLLMSVSHYYASNVSYPLLCSNVVLQRVSVPPTSNQKH